MKRLLGGVALVIAALMVVSSVAMAFDFTDHVKIAPNRKGDVLIYPVYAAIAGWDTKITVINTANDRSVIAKVIFRSAVYTQELLDFMIFLSPTDVWTAIIRFNAATNKVEVVSDDDSCFSSSNVWATAAVPFVGNMITPTCVGDMNTIGYVEVIETAHSVANVTGTTNGMYPALGTSSPYINLNQPPVNKSAIYNAYISWPNGGPSVVQNVVLANDGINVLTGVMEIRNLSINQKGSLEATTLRDYDASLLSTTLLTVGNYTFFGETGSNNAPGELEAALAKNDLAMYYSDKNLTLHFFTFPTKFAYDNYARSSSNVCSPTVLSFQGLNNSPFFRSRTSNGCVTYQGVNYDRSENSSMSSSIVSPSTSASMCNEVNWLSNFGFTEGWARYNFLPATATQFDVRNGLAPYNGAGFDADYTGAPVLGTVVHLGNVDGYGMVSAAHTDGLVRDIVSPAAVVYTLNSVNPTNYYYYQYQDESNVGTGYDADIPVGATQARTPLDGMHPRN